MELTLEQALQKGVEAHKAGQVQDADRYYTAILKANPKHPDANHNMGALAVGVGKVEVALPFFKTATEANSSIEQYWLSYIDALIQLDRMADAKAAFEQAKSNGVQGKLFDKLQEKITPSNLINSTTSQTSAKSLKEHIKIFYTTLGAEVLNSASTGWLYYLRYDQNFLAIDNTDINLKTEVNTTKKPFFYTEINQPSAFKQNNIVDNLNAVEDLKDKFHTLESLNTSENKLLFADSFSESRNFDLKDIQKSVFRRNQLNVVIIGAGPCGLYLSNALKYKFKNDINILVLDNHCDVKHFKKPFSRRWLTHLPLSYFDKYFDTDTGKLARSFGKDGYIGLPINLIEILLLISSKKNSVKFYFDQKFDYSAFDSSLIDIVFDASGGRVPKKRQKNTSDQEIEIQIPNRSMKVSDAGIKNLPVQNVNSDGNFSIMLKQDGFYHYPNFKGTPIFLRMMKLTQVPTSLYPILMKFTQSVSNNRFYIWKGTLSDNINEILVIINLTLDEYDFLKSMISDMQRLSIDLVEKAFEREKLGPDLIDFLNVCAANHDDEIYMNSPFISKPSVNLTPLDDSLNGIEVYPVGDTLFQGNPKVGNGLNTHLRHIKKLVEAIIWRQI